MHGNKGASRKQKLTFSFIHFLAVIIAAWIILGTGRNSLSFLFGNSNESYNQLSAWILIACALIYFFRLILTNFVVLERKMEWDEASQVLIFMFIIHLLFAYLFVYNKSDFVPLDWLWIILYFFGSYLNSGSEWMRMIWKKNPENEGKLYTIGLFRYSMHINYFGDTILFTGFAMLTGSLWALSIPLFMALAFVFMHIPMLDKYLVEKYGMQFQEYASKTKKFIPFIY